jgi:hypothetical protein
LPEHTIRKPLGIARLLQRLHRVASDLDLLVGRNHEGLEPRPGGADTSRAAARIGVGAGVEDQAEAVEPAGLDVVGLEGLTQGRVVDQIDLTDRELIRGAPVHIDQIQLAG